MQWLLAETSFGCARSVMAGQAWSKKAALQVGSRINHGNSHEETPSAVLGWSPESEAQGYEVVLGVEGRAGRSQVQGRAGSAARMGSHRFHTGTYGGRTRWTGSFWGLYQIACCYLRFISQVQQFWPESILKAPHIFDTGNWESLMDNSEKEVGPSLNCLASLENEYWWE